MLELDLERGRQGGVALVNGVSHLVSQVHESLSGDGVAESNRRAVVSAVGYATHQRYLSKELDTEFFGQTHSPLAAEDVVALLGMGRGVNQAIFSTNPRIGTLTLSSRNMEIPLRASAKATS